jgi:hypothetical protein
MKWQVSYFLDLNHALPFELLYNKWSSLCILRSKISTWHAWKLTLNILDLSVVIHYETDQQFMLKFTPIYIVFGSRFTQKSAWARTRARADTRDFYAVIF